MGIKKFKGSTFKLFFIVLLIPFFFTSCILNKQLPDVSNDFNSIMENLVNKSYSKLEKNISKEDVVLVSDFVNLDRLLNHSKLGFLLSDMLKNSLLNKNIYVREVELGKDFKIGVSGFNVLSRKHSEINNTITNEKYAVVGTYSITTKRLIIFIKLIDVTTGTILSSSSDSVLIDEEILDLEKTPSKNRTVYAPVVL